MTPDRDFLLRMAADGMLCAFNQDERDAGSALVKAGFARFVERVTPPPRRVERYAITEAGRDEAKRGLRQPVRGPSERVTTSLWGALTNGRRMLAAREQDR